MTTVLIVLAIIAVIALAWFFLRSRPQLPSVDDVEALPEPTSKPTADAVATSKGETKAEAPKAEAPKAETPKAEAPKAEAPKAEAPKAEAPKAEAPKTEAPVVETPKAEAPVVEAPKAEAPVVEAPKAEAPVAEAPKAEAPVAEAPKAEAPKAPKDLSALRKGLSQTRTGWMQRLLSVFGGKKELDPSLLEQIEETMLTGDIGAGATEKLVSSLKARLDRKELADADKVWDALKEDARSMLAVNAAPFGGSASSKPLVILMVGVNGAGKTTTIAKLADRYKEQGKKVLLAAGDTFRAAAVQQLEMWGRRVGVPVYKGKEGARPSAVIFEAVQQGAKDGVDVVIADTAGRLQTKAPLMEELRKIHDACGKALAGAPHETILVLDATTGQNAISQAREFREALTLSGVVLTKLDGTAKGGVILAVAEEFKLPVRFIGVGEKSHDLREFDADDFVEALFARGEDAAA